MLRIYLDQNKWIDLARAASGHPAGERFADVLAAARSAVDSGTAQFPLDIYRYLETGKRGNDRSRIELADLMFELSQQRTIARPHSILPSEIDEALKRRFGRPAEPRKLEVFGLGIGHITAGKVTLPRFDRSFIPGEAASLSEGELAELERIYDRLAERELLRTGPSVARAAGFDPSDTDFDDRYVAHETFISDEIRGRGLSGDLLELAVRANDLGGIRPAVTEALERIGATWEGFVDRATPDQVMTIMDDLPTRYVTNVMRSAKLRQSEQKWERNDFNDIAALPVAAVYCDVVVTEKQWVHRLRHGNIESRFGTSLLSDTAKLVEVLDLVEPK